MNARFPDAGSIRTVLALASRAPSVHNTQPWRWLVGGERACISTRTRTGNCPTPIRMAAI
jgi:hypothetical protein